MTQHVVPSRPTAQMISSVEDILQSYVPLRPFTYSTVDWKDVGRQIVDAMFGAGMETELGDRVGELLSEVHDDREPLSWNNHGELIWSETTSYCTEISDATYYARGDERIAVVPAVREGGDFLLLQWSGTAGAPALHGWIPAGSIKFREGWQDREGYATVSSVTEECAAAFVESYRKHGNEGRSRSSDAHSDPVNQALRAHYEVPRTVKLWGEEYEITPAVCNRVFGDGKRLIFVEPLNTRPDYYVVQVDSSWTKESLEDHIDDVLLAIGEQFGTTDSDWEEDADGDDAEDGNREEERRGFPVLDEDAGTSWGRCDWPADVAPENAILVQGRRDPREWDPSATVGEREPAVGPVL